MNEEMLKDVLEDVLEELKEANRSLTDARTRLSAVEARVGGFEQRLADQQVIVHPPDLGPVLMVIREQGESLERKTEAQMTAFRGETGEGIKRISIAAATHPVRQWRVCFFPETDHSGNFKHFINWLFGATLVALVVGALFRLGSEYVERVHPVVAEPTVMTMDTSIKIIEHPHRGGSRIRQEAPKMR